MRNICLTILLAASFLSNASAQLSQQSQRKFVSMLPKEVSSKADQLRTDTTSRDTVSRIALLLSNTHETQVHRMQGQDENRTFLHKDGKKEAVYDKNGDLVKDGINDGSYNYFHPQKDSFRHLTFDMAPWIKLGASRTDPTSIKERVHAYSADIFAAVSRIRKNHIPTGEKQIPLKNIGEAEAAAIILVAVEKGKAHDLLTALDSTNEFSEEQLLETVRAFEQGMLSLFSADKAKALKLKDQGS